MTEMVERVAKAIFVKMSDGTGFSGVDGSGTWETATSDDAKESWRQIARAAIAAMREPTEAMIDSFVLEANRRLSEGRRITGDSVIFNFSVVDGYHVMIESALSDKR